MAKDLNELRAVLNKMEEIVNSMTEMDAEILDFVDANYPDALNEQKLIQTFKTVGDAEDELQRQIGLLRKHLAAGIPELNA
ncbi:hypothetical protein ACQE3E_06175 [Methylomonas sp. MED-D]|uniref:Uncharacterized protein n=1 Tax=Methylomonas koyamae TaxID=702114 RepID=A0A177NVG0_9GAMM|nr:MULTISPECIES: hypothetical protein [Methylomonas]NJA07476.1 hypothetical protein [Methylococcaceae bacterium WWC4]MDT4329437.1 hypothetical protein [Methylomonas sp. MV1]OAI22037.1 hypothetical protein A1355_22775 [Methylomonas koyamae]OHX35982.1 hypothetical protein BJL95_02780 [Methylomonas sp. LWB]WGS87380.1 hypothetical protein QC632_06400 [Methylomonas sp. UP202]